MRILAIPTLLTVGFFTPLLSATESFASEPIVIDEAAPELRDVLPRLWAVAFSPDGKSLAVSSGWENPKEPGELVLWDVASKRPTLIRRQDRPIPCLAYSSDGKQVAIGDFSGTTRIVEVQTGKILATLPQHQAIVNAVAFLQDGKTLIAGCFDGSIALWDVVEEKERPSLATPGEQVVGLAVSPKGKFLAATTWEGNVHLWDLPSRRLLHKQRAIAQEGVSQLGVAQAVAFTPDENGFITGSADHSVRLWSVESGKAVREFAGHEAWVQSVAVAPGGKTLASSDGRGTVMIWNLKSGERIAALAAHKSACFGLAFSPDGKQLATASWDRAVKLWNIETGQEVAKLERTAAK